MAPHATSRDSRSTASNLTLIDYLSRRLDLPLEQIQAASPDLSKRLSLLVNSIYLDFLLRHGGGLLTQTVHNEERTEGRLWSEANLAPFQPGPCSSHLLETLQRAFHHPEQACQIPPPAENTGDCIFYHVMFRLTEHDLTLRRWVSALRKSSPLTRLVVFPIVPHHPIIDFDDGQEGRPSLTQQEMDQLLLHPALPYLSGFLADQWAELPLPQATKDFEPQLARLNARRATLLQWMQRCQALGTYSHLRVVMLWMQRLCDQGVETYIHEVQQCRSWKMSVRETMLRGYWGLLRLSETMDMLYQDSIVAPGAFGWEHPEEVRTLMSIMGKRWASGGLRERALACARQFQASMG
ncbi:MAG: hypothetical protein EP343_10665 [Deltaproteobacteria bacterium]|nr:MAG: hypothetical protein EP343_10665 [Deltaproteobacteria bacterium]